MFSHSSLILSHLLHCRLTPFHNYLPSSGTVSCIGGELATLFSGGEGRLFDETTLFLVLVAEGDEQRTFGVIQFILL